MSDTPAPTPSERERRVDDHLTIELISKVSALSATSEATLRTVADGHAAIRSEIASTREVLVEKIEGGDKDAAAIARLLGVQVSNVETTVEKLEPRVTRLERWQGKMAGGLALVTILIPFIIILVQHLWHS